MDGFVNGDQPGVAYAKPCSWGYHISLIRRVSSDHPECGEDRIALEPKAKPGMQHV